MKYILRITNKKDNSIMYFKSRTPKRLGFNVVYHKDLATKMSLETMKKNVNYLIDTKEIEYYNVEILEV